MMSSVVLYTTANVCVKEISHLGTFQLVFLRSTISLVLCTLYLKHHNIGLLGNNRRWLFIRGFVGMLGLAGFFHTVRHIPLATATVIQYFSPVFTVLLAVLFLGERVKGIQWLFLFMAMVGIVMVKGFDPRVSWGMWGLGLVSAGLAAMAYLATMKCKDTDHPVGVVFWFHLLATPIMGALAAFHWTPMNMHDVSLALLVGVLSIAAQVLMTVALHREDAGMVMPFKYLGAVLALAVGWWVFDETMSLLSVLGMAIVVVAISGNTWIKARASSLRSSDHPPAHST